MRYARETLWYAREALRYAPLLRDKLGQMSDTPQAPTCAGPFSRHHSPRLLPLFPRPLLLHFLCVLLHPDPPDREDSSDYSHPRHPAARLPQLGQLSLLQHVPLLQPNPYTRPTQARELRGWGIWWHTSWWHNTWCHVSMRTSSHNSIPRPPLPLPPRSRVRPNPPTRTRVQHLMPSAYALSAARTCGRASPSISHIFFPIALLMRACAICDFAQV